MYDAEDMRGRGIDDVIRSSKIFIILPFCSADAQYTASIKERAKEGQGVLPI